MGFLPSTVGLSELGLLNVVIYEGLLTNPQTKKESLQVVTGKHANMKYCNYVLYESLSHYYEIYLYIVYIIPLYIYMI